MSENQLNRRLAAGIRAAQQGNRERARELLEGVLRQDRNNEQAWIWMAAVVDSQRQRRQSLERVLKINPGNRPAQVALNSMVGVLSGSDARQSIDFGAISAAARTPPPVTVRDNQTPAERTGASSGGDNNLLPFLFGGAIILGLLLAGTLIIPPLLQPAPTETPVPVVVEPTDAGPTIDPNIPTDTPTIPPTGTFDAQAVGDVATNTPAGPTFTPTATLPPTETPLPTATLPALTDYQLLALGQQGASSQAIYRLDGAVSELTNILTNVEDFDYNPETGILVFTRREFIALPTVTPSPSPTPNLNTVGSATQTSAGGLVVTGAGSQQDQLLFRMFVTNINSIDDRTEITNSTLTSAIEPAISPDGRFVAYAAEDDGGDLELYIYEIRTRLSTKLTNNQVTIDTQPQWSPDGTLIIFSSDRVSAGNNDLFMINPFTDDPASTVESVLESRGRNIQPQWSPDGNRIVYLNINGTDTTVRIASTNGRSVQDITFNPSWTYTDPTWTQDGNYILYSASPPDADRQEIRIYAPLIDQEESLRVSNFNAVKVLPR